MFWEIDRNVKQNDAREGKTMQISAKIHQNICKIVQKQAVFSSVKHWFGLKKTVNIDVSTYESVQ